jgi:hypothetical protein
MSALILQYRTAWDVTHTRGVIDVTFGDIQAPSSVRLNMDTPAELAAALAVLKSNKRVFIDADDTGRTLIRAEFGVPGV